MKSCVVANSDMVDVDASDGPTPLLSVLLPVYNAMPWLPIAVRDMLKQRLRDDAALERDYKAALLGVLSASEVASISCLGLCREPSTWSMSTSENRYISPSKSRPSHDWYVYG